MARHLLNDVQIAKARAQDRPYRLFDGDGLAILVARSGSKSWQLRYSEGTATLGKYPTVSLSAARRKADEVRALVADGGNYANHKRQRRVEQLVARNNTFRSIRGDWLKREAKRAKWTEGYREEVEASLDNHLSALDRLPLADITAQIIAPVLRRVEVNAPLMLEKVRRRLNGILWYGVETGAITGNPLPAVRRGPKVQRRHYPAVTKLQDLGAIQRAARAADPCKGVARAHVLLVFSALRVSEVVGAEWAEFALDVGTWSVPRSRMKLKDPDKGDHVVPLPPVLLLALRDWRAADGPDARYVCPAPRDPASHVTPEACEKFYRRALDLGGKHSPHSWRSAFSTVCREAGKDPDVIEAQLDHVVGTKVASAYDRAKRIELRRELLAWYVDVRCSRRATARA